MKLKKHVHQIGDQAAASYPAIGGKPLTREEIIAGLRECYQSMLQAEQEKDPTITCYPDMEAVLDHIEQHGLPPKS